MAYATDIRHSDHGLFDRVSTLLKSFGDARAQRKVYRTTLAELRALNGRDLADLGISRAEIPFIAREAAYGKK
ncbi:DUF1127 domain-containing protein [Maritimibacter sp. UBA3975]|uniref:DUF1127 domain-containing protein n=1 Tax=Maritimibacter sp. UBA3975 TaxID=1946833 RepID=UPI0025BF3BAB|nr:DUF1127 domain-containing protein [Maritimibacter sp. UBA3975]|tara:strand:+ start:21158 stop:21376 length:219 start_codon:yes stop_codon:yes gene_type:complete